LIRGNAFKKTGYGPFFFGLRDGIGFSALKPDLLVKNDIGAYIAAFTIRESRP
jgi:hypothetical protein